MHIYIYIHPQFIHYMILHKKSLQFSSVRESVRKCNGLNNQGLKVGKSRRLSLSQNIQMTSAAYPALYSMSTVASFPIVNPLNPKLNPICYLLALLGAYHFLHVSRIRVKILTFRRLMSYIYGAPILDVSRSHTTTQHSR